MVSFFPSAPSLQSAAHSLSHSSIILGKSNYLRPNPVYFLLAAICMPIHSSPDQAQSSTTCPEIKCGLKWGISAEVKSIFLNARKNYIGDSGHATRVRDSLPLKDLSRHWVPPSQEHSCCIQCWNSQLWKGGKSCSETYHGGMPFQFIQTLDSLGSHSWWDSWNGTGLKVRKDLLGQFGKADILVPNSFTTDLDRVSSRCYLICKALVPSIRARSYLVIYLVVIRGLLLGCAGWSRMSVPSASMGSPASSPSSRFCMASTSSGYMACLKLIVADKPYREVQIAL